MKKNITKMSMKKRNIMMNIKIMKMRNMILMMNMKKMRLFYMSQRLSKSSHKIVSFLP